MKKSIFSRRVPTVFALLILVIIIGVSTVLIQSGIFYVGKAAPDTQPQNFLLTNITDNSFTVTFTTNGLVEAALTMQEAKGGSLILDDRDKKTGTPGKHYSHHITVPNLKPETETRFKLVVGGKSYESTTYVVKTGPVIPNSPPAQNPIFGKILLPDSNPANDSIVVVQTEGSQLISAVTDSKGEFIVPTNSLRNNQGSNYQVLSNDTLLTIRAFRQSMTVRATAIFSIAQNLPPLTLLEEYAFTQSPEKTSTQSSQLDIPLQQEIAQTSSVTSPTNGESFVDQRPLFSGITTPNSTVAVEIVKGEKKQIISKGDGSWSFRPVSNLSQGEHVLKITTSESGEALTISRKFSIFPLGSQVTQSATPSATPTARPTATPTTKPAASPTARVTVTLAPTLSPTVTPTTVITPTTALTPTLVPTTKPTSTPKPTLPAPTPTVIAQIPTKKQAQAPTKLPPIDKPGASENTLALTGFSLLLILSGTILLFIL